MTARVRVLYAEDNRHDADLTRSYFSRNAPDIQLEVVNTGEKCLARLQAEPFDALLLDHHLPDMDGADVLRRLGESKPSLPVVMVTAVGDEALVVQMLRLGACDYVPKQGRYLEALPTVLRNAVADHRGHGRPPASRPQRRRVLYVEANQADIDLTLRHFTEWAPHLTVEIARSSTQALALLRQSPLDLVMTDLRLPDMNAVELLREARQRGLQVPFIVITGRGDESAAVAALKLGASDYIVKRDNYLTQLPYAVENAVDRFELARTNLRLQAELGERERLQRATAETLALLDSLQSHAPIGIAFIDPEFRYQRVNDELATMTGLAPAEHLGRTPAEIVPGIWPQLEPIYRRVLAGEPVLKVEICGDITGTAGAYRHWLCSWYPIRDAGGDVVGIGAFVAEITDRKNAESALREHAAALADSARQKDEFLAMLGHELRNPLAPVRTALELLQRGSAQPSIVQRAHAVMDRQISHMVRIVDDLLDVSRITSGRIRLTVETLDLRQVIADGIDSARPLIDARRQRLELSLPPDSLPVRGDLTRLVQVIANLLNNAAKYTGEGGTIAVHAMPDAGYAVLRVTDTGVGISPRLLAKVFDLFTQDDRTLDRAQGGLGLGLTLVRRITELHGGRVEARSEGRGHGSEFTVRLPLHVQPGVTLAPGRSDMAPSSGAPMRCLVVEDNADAAHMLEFALQFEGHEVRLAFDGQTAIETAKVFRPDAIVLDIGLPGMTGFDVAQVIRRLPGLADVNIIAATGYGQEADRRKGRASGFDHYLVKPIELDALSRALAVGRSISSDR